jgi:APA family basic amino acid/polyamine antiporter
VWLPFLVASAVAVVTALSYLELVTKYPQAAGAALYTHKAFGIHFLTFLVCFTVWAVAGFSDAETDFSRITMFDTSEGKSAFLAVTAATSHPRRRIRWVAILCTAVLAFGLILFVG